MNTRASYRLLGLALALVLLPGCTKKLEEENTMLKAAVAAASQKNSELTAQLAKATAERDGLQARLVDTQKAAETQTAAAGIKVAEAQQANAQLREQLAAVSAQIDSLRESKARAESRVAEMERTQLENQRGELVGTANYYFNANYGEKPDAGSNVYIISPEDAPGITADQFKKYLLLRVAANTTSPEFAKEILTKYNAQIDDWKFIGEELGKSLLTVISSKKTIKLTADGNGSFKMKLRPGRYWAIVRSAHRHALSLLEADGQVSFHEVEIEAGDQANISAKFYP